MFSENFNGLLFGCRDEITNEDGRLASFTLFTLATMNY